MSHTARCVEYAETMVQENCAAQLTAPVWDDAAMEAEDAWVAAWAAEWLANGTVSCLCEDKAVTA
jgi:hypothetical protein